MTYFGIQDRTVYSGIVLLWMVLHHGGLVGPSPAPGKIDVIVVEESADRDSLTAGQRNVILGNAKGSVRDWCSTHCEPNGFELLDKDDDFKLLPAKIQEALKQPRTSVPWLYVIHPQGGFSGPLPAMVETTRQLLVRYGGP